MLAESHAAVPKAVTGRTLNAEAQAAWEGITAALSKVGQAFGKAEPVGAATPGSH